MLDVWAASLPERQAILEFWEWLPRDCLESPVGMINIEEVLDQYHQIDRRQLNRERKDLLKLHQKH